MAIVTPDDLIARISNGYDWNIPFAQPAMQALRTGLINVTSHSTILNRCATLPDLPTLPSGVTSYIPTEFAIANSGVVGFGTLVTELIELGSIDMATGVFTDGSAMPSRTVFGGTQQLASPVLAMFTTAGGGTSRTLTLTYVDQDGNTAETTSALTINNGSSMDAGGTFPLNQGDWGVRDITNVTRTATSGSGTITFYGMVPILLVSATPSTVNAVVSDLLAEGVIRRLGAGRKISIFTVGSAAQNVPMGYLKMVGDS